MADLHTTWGDIARDAVRQRGELYFFDVVAPIAAQLHSTAYSALAAACAERLLSRHLQLDANSQRPFTITCRRPLDCMWAVLGGNPDSATLHRKIENWLQSYYDSPLNHSDGQDGPNDADHDPAAAFIYSAESLIRQSAKSAGWAMDRIVDDAFFRASNDRTGGKADSGRVDDFITDCCHPIVQRELRWLQSIYSYIQTHPLSYTTITELRKQAIMN